MKTGVRVHKARKGTILSKDKRKKNWGNPILDKLMQLKYRINDAYHNDGVDTKDDKNYVMSLIQDIRKHNFKKLAPEDGHCCNGLWRKYAR